jgi:cytochrome subunit of sulfide dehydrogenase
MPLACAARRSWSAAALLPALLLPAMPPAAAETPALHTRALAATCAHCHGTEGRAVQGEAMVALAGLKEDFILTQLLAFRTGQRPATIMHQITRGYSQEQLAEVAKYFATQK